MQTHSGAEDGDGVDMEACRCGDIAHFLHQAPIDKFIPLATALQIADILEHTLWRCTGKPDGSGGAEHCDCRLSGHDLSAIPCNHAHGRVHPLGAGATADTPLVDDVGRCHGHRPRDGCIEGLLHPQGQLQDSPFS